MSTTKDVEQFTTPRKKLLRFFVGSRDGWKAKCAQAKEERKLQANQVRAVEKSRAHWRALAEERQQRITALEAELAGLKNAAP
jgi:hypothetical protein